MGTHHPTWASLSLRWRALRRGLHRILLSHLVQAPGRGRQELLAQVARTMGCACSQQGGVGGGGVKASNVAFSVHFFTHTCVCLITTLSQPLPTHTYLSRFSPIQKRTKPKERLPYLPSDPGRLPGAWDPCRKPPASTEAPLLFPHSSPPYRPQTTQGQALCAPLRDTLVGALEPTCSLASPHWATI